MIGETAKMCPACDDDGMPCALCRPSDSRLTKRDIELLHVAEQSARRADAIVEADALLDLAQRLGRMIGN